MDTLPDLRGENTNEGLCGHDLTELPALLSQMQKGNADRRNTIEKNPLLHSVEILAMISASYGGGADGDAERYNRT